MLLQENLSTSSLNTSRVNKPRYASLTTKSVITKSSISTVLTELKANHQLNDIALLNKLNMAEKVHLNNKALVNLMQEKDSIVLIPAIFAQ